MTTIDAAQVAHIAKLARLELNAGETELFGSQLTNILGHVAKLDELDTADVEPTSHVLQIVNVMRDDTGRDSLSVEEALGNAPDHTDKFYRVPKIIE